VGTNRYTYSFNDPVNGKDPSGHSAEQPNWFDRAVSAVGNWVGDHLFGGNHQRNALVDSVTPRMRPEAAVAMAYVGAQLQYYGSGLDFEAGLGRPVTGFGRVLEWLSGGSKLPKSAKRLDNVAAALADGPVTPPSAASEFTANYLAGSGGRWGSASTRNLNYKVGQGLEAEGYAVNWGWGHRQGRVHCRSRTGNARIDLCRCHRYKNC
jgi:hypothetical protein